MKIRELETYLKEKGFHEGRLDTGCNYTQAAGHIEFICYVEPGMDIQFITLYRWNNNDVKGTYNISIDDFERSNHSVATYFRRTKNNMPQRIGESVDTHKATEEAIEEIFR